MSTKAVRSVVLAGQWEGLVQHFVLKLRFVHCRQQLNCRPRWPVANTGASDRNNSATAGPSVWLIELCAISSRVNARPVETQSTRATLVSGVVASDERRARIFASDHLPTADIKCNPTTSPFIIKHVRRSELMARPGPDDTGAIERRLDPSQIELCGAGRLRTLNKFSGRQLGFKCESNRNLRGGGH